MKTPSAIIPLFTLTACAALSIQTISASNASEQSLSVLPGDTWTSSQGSVSFHEDQRFSANMGCNTLNGSYDVEGSQLIIGPIISTRMACQNMEPESNFIEIFNGTLEPQISGNKIVIHNQNGLLTFEKDS